MPTLNLKLLLRVLAATVVVVVGLVVLNQVQANRVPDALLWQANAAAEKGKTDKAIFYMRQYLEFRPDDYDMAVKLADMMAERAVTAKDIANAHFLYERVLRKAPQRSDVARKLVALCIRMGRHADALAHAERLLREFPNDGELNAQVAECQLAQNRPTDARRSFEKAVMLAPENVRAFDLYARLLARHFKQPAEARAVLDRMVQANPGHAEAYLVRARLLKSEDRQDDCMRDLDRALLLDPENGEALVMSAEILQAHGEIRRAKEALRDTIATYPRFVHGYRALSWLELLGGNQTDARATLERGIAMIPDAPELLTPLADLWIEHGELDRVESAIQKLEARKDAAARVSYMRGRLLMKQGKWNDAVALLETLRSETVALPGLAPQLNLLIAGCHEHRGDRTAQVEALRRALAADPKHLSARVALANVHLNSGRIDEAIKEYQLAARSPYAGLGVQLALTGLRLSSARVAETSNDEWKSIATSIAELRMSNPQSIEPIVLLAELNAARGDFAAAVTVLREEAKAKPGDPRIWSALAAMLARGYGTLAAAEALSEGQNAAGESIEMRLARARLWADDIQPGRARRLAKLEELSPTIGDAERCRFLIGMAELYAGIRDAAGSMRMLTELASRNTRDLDSRKALYALALDGDDEKARTQWRDEIRRLEGTAGRSVAILDALHEIRQVASADRRLTGWQDLARGVIADSPDNIDAHLLMSMIAERRGDAATAARHLDLAVELDPTAQRCHEARLGYLLRTGQDDKARSCLSRFQADPRIAPFKFRAIVEGAILAGGPESLAKCQQWLAQHCKREPRLSVWLGRLLESRGKVSDAIALYKQTTTSNPAFVDAWSARLVAASRIGETEVNETMADVAKSGDRKTLFAMCAESGAAVRVKLPNWSPPITAPDDRRSYAQACLAACEARGRLEDAVPIFAAIADDTNGRPEDIAWAKRTLAALTAALGNPDQKRDADRVAT